MSVVIDHVNKSYGKIEVLRDINITITKPGCYAILGPNGAGKTTLFRIISTLITPDSGTVKVNDYDVFKQREVALRDVGFLVSVPEPPDFLTVKEFISFSARLRGRTADIKKLNEMLDLPPINQRCGKLSKGQKRRTYLAALLAQDPKVLVLDEPTDGLDPIEIIKIKDVIKEIKKSKIILYSSHILSEVSDMCDYIYIMNKGKIIYNGSVYNIKRMFKPKSIKVEFNYEVPVEDIKATLGTLVTEIKQEGSMTFELGFDGTPMTRREILRRLVNNYEVRNFYDTETNLEEAFVKILRVFGDGGI
ncbi:ABC transporter ATP-binding protein [Stygiolobus caldivivus]|uniref:Antibiotic ABC transporter ATP-binding protein n=1 Tax=Stygiolobus caldivivus TaxID=2824673 RepID=A0A8D5U4N7_9CREN|nr:ABC transporter ATP-binding protein [Stygiolobus caldivivus]BCU68889.1 antibiotic ABC transporter ATP-binding protein [Stygiolobus caldivivus]